MREKKPVQQTEKELPDILTVKRGFIRVHVLGTSPFVYNAKSFQKKVDLLIPPRKARTEADREARGPKHNPLEEYRQSVYAHLGNDRPTRLMFTAGAFKKAMAKVARHIPGMTQTEIMQLLWLEPKDIDIYGIPELYMAPVTLKGISRAPDIRTRAMLKQWGCSFTIGFASPMVKSEWVGKLAVTSGILCGVGDGRQEKGHGNGQYALVSEDNADLRHLMKIAGRAAQDAALANPEYADRETAQLMAAYLDEVARREQEITGEPVVLTKPNGRKAPKARREVRL